MCFFLCVLQPSTIHRWPLHLVTPRIAQVAKQRGGPAAVSSAMGLCLDFWPPNLYFLGSVLPVETVKSCDMTSIDESISVVQVLFVLFTHPPQHMFTLFEHLFVYKHIIYISYPILIIYSIYSVSINKTATAASLGHQRTFARKTPLGLGHCSKGPEDPRRLGAQKSYLL